MLLATYRAVEDPKIAGKIGATMRPVWTKYNVSRCVAGLNCSVINWIKVFNPAKNPQFLSTMQQIINVRLTQFARLRNGKECFASGGDCKLALRAQLRKPG